MDFSTKEANIIQNQRLSFLTGLAVSAALLAGLWLFFRFLLPWTAPFLLAYALAALAEGQVRAMVASGWRRPLAAALATLAVAGALSAAAFFLISQSVVEATEFAERLPELLESLGSALSSAEGRALELVESSPEGVRGYMAVALDSITEALYSLPAVISEKLLSLIGSLAQASPSVLLFTVTTVIGIYFISASYPDIADFINRQIPQRFHTRIKAAREALRGTIGRMLSAQALLMALTFAELLIAFVLLRVRGAVTAALIIALIDALPVLGTGTVLLPWALWCFMGGERARALGLLAVYAIVTLLRSILQPKLVGDRLGLHPAASLLAIYAGWSACGVWGMLLFPVLAVAAKQLNDSRVLRLWKKEA